MPKKVLVTFATRSGTTSQVADTVADVLRKAGLTTEVLPVKDVRSVDGFDAVVLGTAIRIGKPMPELMQLVKKQRSRLSQLPVAAFAVAGAVDFLAPLLPASPVDFFDFVLFLLPALVAFFGLEPLLSVDSLSVSILTLGRLCFAKSSRSA